jgi:hypothetical protein
MHFFEIEDYIKDNDGRFLICILKVNNEKTLLANYYGLNTDEIYLLEDFCNRIEQFFYLKIYIYLPNLTEMLILFHYCSVFPAENKYSFFFPFNQ